MKYLTVLQMASIKVQTMSDKGRIPTRGTSKAAGFDLYAAESVMIPPRDRALVWTDIKVKNI